MRRVFRILFNKQHISQEVDDELAFHLEMRIQRLIAAGYPPDAARREALRQFGDVASVRDSMVTMDQQRERAMRRANMMSEMQQDLVYALRTLRRNKGFTAIIVAALAIGIGANTSIFTLIDAVLMRRLPVVNPEQLVIIGDPSRTNSFSQGSPRVDLISVPLYHDLRDQNQLFSGMIASGRAPRLDARIDGAASGEPEHPRGRMVSGNYFDVLGVKPMLGRVFDASTDKEVGSTPAVVISNGYWVRRFKSDPSVVGKTILINGVKLAIIGVAPVEFTGEIVGASPDMWLPITVHDVIRPNQKVFTDRNSGWLVAVGRLKPGATLQQAQKQVPELLVRNIVANTDPQTARGFQKNNNTRKYYVVDGSRGLSRVRSTFQAPLVTLMVGVALLLCIICANVANLLLARAIARGREMGVRLALGAGRSRLVRQLMTESLLLALLSAGVGLLIAWWGSRALITLAADGGTIPLDLGMDLPVLAFTLVVSVLAVALFGLAPALRASRVDLASTMRANAHSVAGSALGNRGQRAPLGKMLIAAQVALSVVLLVGAGMLVRSLRNLQNVDVGLDRDHIVMLDIDINTRGLSGASLATAVRSVRSAVAAIPGVSAVTYSENGIFSGTESMTSFQLPGFEMKSPNDSLAAYDQVGPEYVKSIGGRIVAGRDMMLTDEDRLPRTALVNESFAKFYFPGKSAVGQFLRFSDTVAVEIVGVVADTRDHDLTSDVQKRFYMPYLHANDSLNFGVSPGTLNFAIRTKGDPAALVQTIRKTVASVDPTLVIDDINPLSTMMATSIRQQRLVAKLASAFGTLALILAAIGLYGVMTYAITRRTGEIGLRVALGAEPGDVVRMVLVDALKLVAIGVIIGLPLAMTSVRALKTQLHDVATADPVSISVAIGVLATSAVIAVLLPALRASRVSPIVALRAD
jgi:predicted permease